MSRGNGRPPDAASDQAVQSGDRLGSWRSCSAGAGGCDALRESSRFLDSYCANLPLRDGGRMALTDVSPGQAASAFASKLAPSDGNNSEDSALQRLHTL